MIMEVLLCHLLYKLDSWSVPRLDNNAARSIQQVYEPNYSL